MKSGGIQPDETSIELIAKHGLNDVLRGIPHEHLVTSQQAFLLAIEAGNFPQTSDLLLERGVCQLQDAEIYQELILNENLAAMAYSTI